MIFVLAAYLPQMLLRRTARMALTGAPRDSGNADRADGIPHRSNRERGGHCRVDGLRPLSSLITRPDVAIAFAMLAIAAGSKYQMFPICPATDLGIVVLVQRSKHRSCELQGYWLVIRGLRLLVNAHRLHARH